MIKHSMRIAPDAEARAAAGLLNDFRVYSEDTRTNEGCRSDYVSKAEAREMLKLLPSCTPDWADDKEKLNGCRRFYALRKRVGEWYRAAFPTDELGQNIRDITFSELFGALAAGIDVYSTLGAGDSLVRERCFEKLAEITDTDYGFIYDLWLHPMEGRCNA